MQACSAIATSYNKVLASKSRLAPSDLAGNIVRPLATFLLTRSCVGTLCITLTRQDVLKAEPGLRTALALVMRSLAEPDAASNIVSWAAAVPRHSANGCTLMFEGSYSRFAVLCACLCSRYCCDCGPPSLLCTAAARCLFLLLDTPRKLATAAGSFQAQYGALAASCSAAVADQNDLFSALSHMLHSTAPPADDLLPHEDTGPVSGPDVPALLTSNLFKSASLALELLQTAVPQKRAAASAAAYTFVALTMQGRAAASRVLRSAPLLSTPPHSLLRSLLVSLRHSEPMSPLTALSALCNVCTLVAGPVATARPQAGKKQQPTLQRSVVLGDAVVAGLYIDAALAVLGRAAAARVVATEVLAWQECLAMAWPFSQSLHLLELLNCAKRLDSEEASAVVAGGGPAASTRELYQDKLMHIYVRWVQVADAVDAIGTGHSAASPYVNLMAFSAAWMQQLWRTVSHTCCMPAEVLTEADRGLVIESLCSGVAVLQTAQIQLLALFCRLYSRLLLVLDDDAFFEGREPFPLATHRAIALSLNSLLFYSYLPKGSASGAAPARLNSMHVGLCTEAAVALRQLYDRQVRRSYCSAAAWLAPWEHSRDGSEDMDGQMLMADVLRVLLARSDADGDGSAVADGGQARATRIADLLAVVPHAVPFGLRVQLFRQLLLFDKKSGRWDGGAAQGPSARLVVVKRGAVLLDAFRQLAPLGTAIKGQLSVAFVDKHGNREAGIDHGGLLKELLEELMLAGFEPAHGLMETTPAGQAYPSPLAARLHNGLALLRFLGLVVGKALYEGILLDVTLAPLFIMALQRRPPSLDDLFTLDAALHRSLLQVKNYDGDVAGLCLDFTVEEEVLGERSTHELVPNGRDVPVTNDNKLLYVHLVADWHLSRKTGSTSVAFADGLSQVVPITFLRMFSVTEVNELLGGGDGAHIDCTDLRAHVRYAGGYSVTSTTVRLFWRVFASLCDADRRALLRFVTGTSRTPLGGFRHLEPPLVIYKVDCAASLLARLGGPDVEKLPTASTCFNMLKLPNYRRFNTMRKKLLYAVHSQAGFDLS